MARLSVIVTSYNVEDYLEACLESVVGQTLEDLEIIVVDDGSTDGSPDIVARFAARDERVRPVLLPDNSVGGVATAANAGLDLATGDYVGFADGDDLYDPTMFARLLAAAVDADADLAMCNYDLIDDTDATTARAPDQPRWDDLDGTVHDLEDVETARTFLAFVAVPWRKIYRRSMLENGGIRFPVGDHFYEDNPFHWFTVLSASSVAVVPEVLCHHRVARVGQTRSAADERLLRIFDHHDTILAWLREHDLADTYRTTLLGWAISQAGWVSQQVPAELRPQLWERLRSVYGQYDAETVEQALVARSAASRSRALTRAVLDDDRAAFDELLDHDHLSGGVLEAARHHLRHRGVAATAGLAGRHASRRVRAGAGKAYRAASRLVSGRSNRSRRRRVDRRDLLFGLTVLDERLRRVEQQLDDLARQDDGADAATPDTNPHPAGDD